MDAELTHERTLVREGADSGRLAGRAAGLKHVCGRATISRLQLLVHNVDAHGSLRVHVPLGPRTDVPHLPVVVAGAGKAIGDPNPSSVFSRAQQSIGCSVIRRGNVGAIH